MKITLNRFRSVAMALSLSVFVLSSASNALAQAKKSTAAQVQAVIEANKSNATALKAALVQLLKDAPDSEKEAVVKAILVETRALAPALRQQVSVVIGQLALSVAQSNAGLAAAISAAVQAEVGRSVLAQGLAIAQGYNEGSGTAGASNPFSANGTGGSIVSP